MADKAHAAVASTDPFSPETNNLSRITGTPMVLAMNAFKFGCDGPSDILAMAKSIMSHPALHIARALATTHRKWNGCGSVSEDRHVHS